MDQCISDYKQLRHLAFIVHTDIIVYDRLVGNLIFLNEENLFMHPDVPKGLGLIWACSKMTVSGVYRETNQMSKICKGLRSL